MEYLKRLISISAVVGAFAFVAPQTAHAEYADVVINNYADAAGMRPVVFPHWYHRIRFRCKVCHADLGFAFKAGGNKITMAKIIDGQFCGACHNGEISWSVENCGMCHSGVPGTPTQIHGSTVQRLIAPAYKSLDGGGAPADAPAGAAPASKPAAKPAK
jgi:c(7)-type cytochrome triheme protein